MATETEILETRLDLLGLSNQIAGMNQVREAFLDIGDAADVATQRQLLMGFGAIAAGIGIVKALTSAAAAAGEEQQAVDNASNSFRSHGESFPTDALADFASQLQDLTGVEDASIARTIGLLGTFGLARGEAERLTPALLDAARALEPQGATPEGLATAIGKALQGGNVAGLRRMGIFVDEAAFKVDRLGAVFDALASQGSGAAAQFRDSTRGGFAALTNAAGDAAEAIGGTFVPVLRAAQEVGVFLLNTIRNIPGFAQLIGIAAVAAAGGLFYYGSRAVAAAFQTMALARAHLQAAQNARTQAAAERDLAGATTQAGNAAAGAAGKSRLQAFGGLLASNRLGLGIGLATGLAGFAISQATAGRGGRTETFGQVAGSALNFAGLGAMLGSVIPGLGTILGGIVGAGLGAVIGSFQAREREADAKKARDEQDTLKGRQDLAVKQAQLAQQGNDLLAQIRDHLSDAIGSSELEGVIPGQLALDILGRRIR